MKLRLGFVTNSSSTTHIMMWKGDKGRLKELLDAHQRHFDLRYVDWEDQSHSVTPDEVAGAILSMMEKAQKASAYVRAKRQKSRMFRKMMEKSGGNKFLDEDIRKTDDKARRAKEFDWVLEVGFGDNHGDFSGKDLGVVMDYEGRRIHIVDADRGFYYTTEQDR